MQTYITTDELATRIHYDARTIRTRLKDAVLLEGIHYIRPFGGRKLLFIWETIQRDIGRFSVGRGPSMSSPHGLGIPMANGGTAHG
ncbi:MAG TPA: hypothetical protein VN581_03990 [Patescibacteria group bacterium]|nr:hypothetical protein [Patescibacteria group bacterium]